MVTLETYSIITLTFILMIKGSTKKLIVASLVQVSGR